MTVDAFGRGGGGGLREEVCPALAVVHAYARVRDGEMEACNKGGKEGAYHFDACLNRLTIPFEAEHRGEGEAMTFDVFEEEGG